MQRLNDSNERVLERLRALEASVSLRSELGRGTNTLLASRVASVADVAGRVTRVENKS